MSHGIGSTNGGKGCDVELMASPSREITTAAHGEGRQAMLSEAKNYVTFDKEL